MVYDGFEDFIDNGGEYICSIAVPYYKIRGRFSDANSLIEFVDKNSEGYKDFLISLIEIGFVFQKTSGPVKCRPKQSMSPKGIMMNLFKRLLSSKKAPAPPLPPAVMSQKLYSPLSAKIWYKANGENYDDEYESDPVSQEEALRYKEEIHEALVWSESEDMKDRGLMQAYFDADSVNEKVRSLHVDVEEHAGKLWGVANLALYSELSPDELARLRVFISGHYSDGFGEAFEEREIVVGDGDELSVSLWFYGGYCMARPGQVAAPRDRQTHGKTPRANLPLTPSCRIRYLHPCSTDSIQQQGTGQILFSHTLNRADPANPQWKNAHRCALRRGKPARLSFVTKAPFSARSSFARTFCARP